MSRRPAVAVAVTVLLILLGMSGLLLGRVAVSAVTPPRGDGSPERPGLPGVRNVVLVLADDLDWAAFRAVPRLAALQQQGTTFTRFGVAGSLCCPSRASILRGQYLHNHGVVSNGPPDGGWPRFRDLGLAADCLPVWLQAAGVRTALIGKYLNNFPSGDDPTLVPPGWDHWTVPVAGAKALGFGYVLARAGRLERHGQAPQDFLGDVLQADALQFIDDAPERFYLQVAPYTPHAPFGVAPRNADRHAGAQVPRTAAYDQADVSLEPPFLQRFPRLSSAEQTRLDRLWSRRLDSAESVADLVEAVQARLLASGHADDTLLVVTSDNGFHVGQHRLPPGKQTAYDEDVLVPTVLIGPGVPAGRTVDALVSEVDLAPTVAEVLGAAVPAWVDGVSLLPWLSGAPTSWRDALLLEHLASPPPGDPDSENGWGPPDYLAMRTADLLYVEYESGARQLYDLRADPDQVVNLAPGAPAELLVRLNQTLHALAACAGESCRRPYPVARGPLWLLPSPASRAVAVPTVSRSPGSPSVAGSAAGRSAGRTS